MNPCLAIPILNVPKLTERLARTSLKTEESFAPLSLMEANNFLRGGSNPGNCTCHLVLQPLKLFIKLTYIFD